MPVNIGPCGCCNVVGQGHHCGGMKLAGAGPTTEASASNHQYNQSTAAWAAKASFTSVGNLPWGGVVSGLGYVMGGANLPAHNKNQEYNKQTDTVTARTNIPANTSSAAGGSALGAVYLVASGTGGTNREYTPDTWVSKTAITRKRNSLGGTSQDGFNTVFIFGGQNTGTSASELFTDEYTPLSDAWGTKTNMPAARHFLRGFVMGATIVLPGGLNQPGGGGGGSPQSSVYEYTPGGDSWVTKGALPYTNFGHSAFSIGSKGYIAGGDSATAGICERLALEWDSVADTWTSIAITPVPGTQNGIGMTL